jgi:hypothetical protein
MTTERTARLRLSIWCMPAVRPANKTAVSVGPIVTNSVTKLDGRLEGTCIEIPVDRDGAFKPDG